MSRDAQSRGIRLDYGIRLVDVVRRQHEFDRQIQAVSIAGLVAHAGRVPPAGEHQDIQLVAALEHGATKLSPKVRARRQRIALGQGVTMHDWRIRPYPPSK